MSSSGLFAVRDIKRAQNVEKYIANSPNFLSGRQIYRCIGYDLENLTGNRKAVLDSLLNVEPGSIIDMEGTSSWSSDAVLASQFGIIPHQASGRKELFMFVLEGGSQRSTSLTSISQLPVEQEVAVSMFQKFEVVSKEFGPPKDILKIKNITDYDELSDITRNRWIIKVREVK